MTYEAPEPLILPHQQGPLALMPSDCPEIIVQGPVGILGDRVFLGDVELTSKFIEHFPQATRQTPGGDQKQCGFCVATFKFYSS